MERIVEKMCHAPAICFEVEDRGFLDEGAWADVVVLDPNKEWTVDKSNILYKCGWSPFEGHTFRGQVTHTLVSGRVAFENGKLIEGKSGERLTFNR
jgi:dihydroorotase